jgi:hypothetical protein
MTKLTSRLEKLYYRLEAQCACLNWAFGQIAGLPGIVFELGLGHGRTFDHFRRYLPGRDIYVFDRQVDSYPECTPDPDQMLIGDLSDTLPRAALRFSKQVILAHSDVGSFSSEHNSAMSAVVSAYLPSALMDGALILSDLPLSIPNAARLPLPPGAREDRYFIYRFRRS